MQMDYPHEIKRMPAKEALDHVVVGKAPSGDRRWFPLSDQEAEDLDSKTSAERAAWLASQSPTEYLARHLEAAGEPHLAERARRGEFAVGDNFLDRVLTDKARFDLRARLRAGEFSHPAVAPV